MITFLPIGSGLNSRITSTISEIIGPTLTLSVHDGGDRLHVLVHGLGRPVGVRDQGEDGPHGDDGGLRNAGLRKSAIAFTRQDLTVSFTAVADM